MKKLLAVILSALTLCTVTACSSGSGMPSAEEDFTEIDAAKLPSKVDLRNFEGKNYVTPVKTQWFGDCWTFSLTGADDSRRKGYGGQHSARKRRSYHQKQLGINHAGRKRR